MKRLPWSVAVAFVFGARVAAAQTQPHDPQAGAPLVPPAQTPPAPAPAPPPTPAAAAKPEPLVPGLELTRMKLNGYLLPLFVFSHRNNAVARDRFQVGALSSRIGLILQGNPYEQWSYRIEVGFDAALVNEQQRAGRLVSDVSVVASPNGGINRNTYNWVTRVPVEEASVSFQPIEWYTVKAGHMRMPFSVAQAATVTTTMFPNRPGPTEVFLSGPDDGILNIFDFLDGRVQARVGAFNGSSLGLKIPNTTTLGPVYSAFMDVHPLGRMPGREGGAVLGPFRFGLGLGILYRLGTLFDDTGYEATRFSDTRLSAAARIAVRGLFVQGELLRRVQTDNLSLRPAIATGFYGQGSFYQPIGRIALGPLLRVGYSVQDQNFAPQKTLSYEGGLAFYPRSDRPEPDALRIIVQYAGEHRTPSEETANGAIVQLQMKW